MQRSMQAPLHQPFTLVFQNCIGRFVSTNLTDTRTSLAVRHNNITLCLGPGTYVLGPLPPPRRNAHILEPPNRVRSFSAAQHASIYQLSSSPPLPSPANSPSSAPLPSIMVINHHHARLGHAQFLFARSLALFEIHVGCMQELF